MNLGTAAAAILVSVTGCAAGELPDVQVSAADLTNIELSSAAVLFGGTWGDGDLVVVDGVGDEQTFPVTLSGPSLGMMIDFSVDGEGALEEGEASFDISAMELPTANELLGLYTGPKASGHLILGGASYDLAGDNGAKMSIGLWGAGVSIYGGVEWLTLAAR